MAILTPPGVRPEVRATFGGTFLICYPVFTKPTFFNAQLKSGTGFSNLKGQTGANMNIRMHNHSMHDLIGEGIRWGLVVAMSAGALLLLAKYVG